MANQLAYSRNSARTSSNMGPSNTHATSIAVFKGASNDCGSAARRGRLGESAGKPASMVTGPLSAPRLPPLPQTNCRDGRLGIAGRI
jgi:hypothetical protein